MTIDHDMPKHQAALRDSNMASINDINRAPLCCTEGIEIVDEVKPGRRIPWGIVITAIIGIGIGFSLALFGYAYAAERGPAWDVFAFREGRLLQADARNIVPVESSGPFPTKRLCDEVGIQTVKIRDAGWRLSCRRIDQ